MSNLLVMDMVEKMNEELADAQDTAEEALSRANAANARAAATEQRVCGRVEPLASTY